MAPLDVQMSMRRIQATSVFGRRQVVAGGPGPGARRSRRRRAIIRAGPVEIREDDLLQLPDRLQWYETKFAADDMPDWNAARLVAVRDVAPGLRSVKLEVEVSRERVPLRSAYKLPGQLAQLRVSGGEARALPVVTPPHSLACNKEALFLTKGDIFAYEVKSVREPLSVQVDLEVLVSREEAPEVWAVEDDNAVELGPFLGHGLDLAGSGLLAIWHYRVLVLFVAGHRGMATAAALLGSSSSMGTGLNPEFREDVRVYYQVPNLSSAVCREHMDAWAARGVRVAVTTNSFQDAWDDDDTLVYDPATTGAIILVGDDEEAEAAARAVCAEAEITAVLSGREEAAAPVYLSSTPKSFARWAPDAAAA